MLFPIIGAGEVFEDDTHPLGISKVERFIDSDEFMNRKG